MAETAHEQNVLQVGKVLATLRKIDAESGSPVQNQSAQTLIEKYFPVNEQKEFLQQQKLLAAEELYKIYDMVGDDLSEEVRKELGPMADQVQNDIDNFRVEQDKLVKTIALIESKEALYT